MTIDFEEWFKNNVSGLYEQYIKHPDYNVMLNNEALKDLLEKAYNHHEPSKKYTILGDEITEIDVGKLAHEKKMGL